MARLIDSSLWIDFSRRKTSATLKEFIYPFLIDPAAVLCEPVAFEVLRFATPAELPDLRQQLDTLPILTTPAHLWEEATILGQTCRKRGVNAGALDLLIATLAIHHGAELITFDSDFAAIAMVSSLKAIVLQRP